MFACSHEIFAQSDCHDRITEDLEGYMEICMVKCTGFLLSAKLGIDWTERYFEIEVNKETGEGACVIQ